MSTEDLIPSSFLPNLPRPHTPLQHQIDRQCESVAARLCDYRASLDLPENHILAVQRGFDYLDI